MILDELTLHNFGIYGGRQSMPLTPIEPSRPIVLVGGLNGAGKTTLLDALQLCLFGPAARCSNRNGLAYDDYLRRCVHRGADSPESALELAFRHTSNGVEERITLHRSWTSSNSGARERFHVLRNGRVDRVATEHWAEQVEDFIPSRIAHLFFFDGEKVEAYADLDGAPALIAAAVHNLLGLDLVERLTADLQVLERRHRAAAKPAADRASLDELKSRVDALALERDGLARRRGELIVQLDRAAISLNRAEDDFRREGGGLYERRADLEARAAAAGDGLAQARKDIVELAAGTAPLLLVRQALRAVAVRDAGEVVTRRSRDALRAVEEEHAAVLGLPSVARLDAGARGALARALSERLDQRRLTAERSVTLDLGDEARGTLAALAGPDLEAFAIRVVGVLDAERDAHALAEATGAAVSATPSQDAVAALAERRDAARAALAALQGERDRLDETVGRLDRDLGSLRETEAKLLEADARDRFEKDDVRRLVDHSARVRGTLGKFREAVVARHVARIQDLVLESFQRLVRKRGLVANLMIDPRTFALDLVGGDGLRVTPDRLSAGERQLLAIAILWGLARASGRPLPTVVDTPLGRLDSIHRDHLVRRYFPHASHQVILLSTDEEIAGGYLDAIRPSVDRFYRLRFDEALGGTLVEPGYLDEAPQRARLVHAH